FTSVITSFPCDDRTPDGYDPAYVRREQIVLRVPGRCRRFPRGSPRLHSCAHGPNGTGKTTLFNLATKFLHPSGGRIHFKGRDITHESASAVARLGMVRSFQISAVFQSMRENVRVALQTSRNDCFAFWRSAAMLNALNARADALLDDVGLADLRGRKA